MPPVRRLALLVAFAALLSSAPGCLGPAPDPCLDGACLPTISSVSLESASYKGGEILVIQGPNVGLGARADVAFGEHTVVQAVRRSADRIELTVPRIPRAGPLTLAVITDHGRAEAPTPLLITVLNDWNEGLGDVRVNRVVELTGLMLATSEGLLVFDSVTGWAPFATGGKVLPTHDLAVLWRDLSDWFVATSEGVYVTRDSGDTWTTGDVGFPTGRPEVLAIAPNADRTLVFAGLSSGIYRSEDDGATWVPLVDGLPTTPGLERLWTDEGDRDRLYALWSGRLYRTVDAGNSWSGIQPPGATAIRSLAVGNEALIAVGAGVLYRSRDGGDTWVELDRDLAAAAFERPAASPATALWGLDDAGAIHFSPDGGATWSSVIGETTELEGVFVRSGGNPVFYGPGGVWSGPAPTL